MRGFLLLSALTCGLCCSLRAQEHPFLLSYTLTELDGAIQVAWTIQGGSTCNGQDIERSLDGIDFERVHRIEGICGDPTFAVPFQWIDDAPPEFTTVYYRIKLGFDGYSSAKPIYFGQLTSTDQRFFPSPMRDDATLLLNISSTINVALRIWDTQGHQVFAEENISGPSIQLNLPGLAPGVYVYQANAQGKLFKGRFVKE